MFSLCKETCCKLKKKESLLLLVFYQLVVLSTATLNLLRNINSLLL